MEAVVEVVTLGLLACVGDRARDGSGDVGRAGEEGRSESSESESDMLERDTR